MKSHDELKKRNQIAELGGGKIRIDKQHSQGKLTARERINLILDENSFNETDKFITHKSSNFGLEKKVYLGDGVVTGWGEIENKKIFIFAQDFTVFGGSLASQHAKKIVKIMERAAETGCPIIGLNDSGGARIQEGIESLAGYADIFYRNTLYSGVVPQISLILGPCAGGAVYSPAITDFIIMVNKKSHMFITGPDVIKAVTREEVNKEDLGGALTHSTKSGVADLVANDEQEALNLCRKLLSYIPENNRKKAKKITTSDPLDRKNINLTTIVPDDNKKPYDMKDVIKSVADENIFFEIKEDFAKNILTGFIRLNGESIGVVGNQPKFLAGCLDIDSSTKAARFVRFCDAFNIPILTFVDVPGFLPGVRQEHNGIIRHGAKLLYAYSEATVPKITVITRKAYGGAYDVMSSKHIGADFNFAWPSSEIAVMGAEGAVNIIFRKDIIESENPEKLREELTRDYKTKFSGPWEAASLGFIDAVIEPQNTRKILCNSFEVLENKVVEPMFKKHGNLPL